MKKKLLWLLLFLLVAIACTFALIGCGGGDMPAIPPNSEQETTTDNQREELTSTQIFQKVNPSVVFVLISRTNSLASGSGFFIDKNGTIVTNYHVIKDGVTGVIQLHSGETATIQTVIGYNEELDIAILSTSARNTTPVTLGNSSIVQIGNTVFAIGYPEAFTVGFSSSTFTTGMVSMNRSINGYTYIQSTVDITKGNSGGVLIDTYGEVIGITTAGLKVGDVDYMNLSIPVQRIDTVSRNVNESLEIVTKRHYPVYVTYYADNRVHLRQSLKYEDTPARPKTPTKVGYTFADWYSDENCQELFDFGAKIVDNTVAYAKFSINTYKVNYNLSFGNWTNGKPQNSYTIDDCNKELPKARRNGYVFEGWRDSNGEFIDNFPTSSNLKDLTLTASWIEGTDGLIINQCNVVGYDGTDTEIIIPELYRNQPITGINEHIFAGNNNIVSLTLPVLTCRIGRLFSSQPFEGAEKISQRTGFGFNDWETCYISSNLKKVFVNSGNIVTGCFSGCSLSEISLGKDVQSAGGMAFGNVEKFLLQGSIAVGEYTFSGCHIKEIYIDTVENWLAFRFGDGSYQTQNWSSPFSSDTKLYINNELLTKVVIPNDINVINEGIFRGYNYLTNVVITSQVTSISGYAFSGCSNLQTVVFEDKKTWYTSYLGYTSGSDQKMDLDDANTNAKNLTDTYVHYRWYRGYAEVSLCN